MKEGDGEKKWLELLFGDGGDSETTFDTLSLRIDNIIDQVQIKSKVLLPLCYASHLQRELPISGLCTVPSVALYRDYYNSVVQSPDVNKQLRSQPVTSSTSSASPR